MTDMQGSRRICRDKFDIDGPPIPNGTSPVRRPRGEDRGQSTHHLCCLEEKVDEPRPRNFGFANQAPWQLDRCHEPLRDGARLLTESLCQG